MATVSEVLVAQAIYRTRIEASEAGFAAATAAAKNLTGALQAQEDLVTKATPSFTALEKSISGAAKMTAELDKAQRQLQGRLKQISEEYKKEGKQIEDAQDLIVQAQLKYQERVEQIQARAAAAAGRAGKLLESNFAQGLSGANELADAMVRVKAELDSLSGGASNTTAAQKLIMPLTELRAQINPLARATMDYRESLAVLADAEVRGAATAAELFLARGRLESSYMSETSALREYAATLDMASAKMKLWREAQLSVSAMKANQIFNENYFSGQTQNSPNIRSATNETATTSARSDDIKALGAELEGLAHKYDPLYAAQQRYSASLTEISKIETAEFITAERAAEARERVTTAFNAETAAIINGKTARRDFDEERRIADLKRLYATYDAGAAVLSDYNRRLTDISDAENRSIIDPSQAVVARSAALRNLTASIDPVVAAEKRHQDQMERNAAAAKLGALTSDQLAAANARSKVAYDREIDALSRDTVEKKKNAEATSILGLRSYESLNLTYQMYDIITQAGSGASAFIILVQQGPQIAQIFGGFGPMFKRLAESIVPLLTSTYAMIGAVTLLGAAWVASSIAVERSEQSILNIGQALRQSRGDYEQLGVAAERTARKLAETTGITTPDARKTNQILLTVPGAVSTQEDLERLNKLAQDVARALGTTVPDAASQFVVKAITEPSALMQTLADQYNRNLNPQMMRQVELLEQQGHKAEASAIAMRTLFDTFKGAEQARTPMESFFKAVSQDATNLWNQLVDINREVSILLLNRAGMSRAAGVLSNSTDNPRMPSEATGYAPTLGTLPRREVTAPLVREAAQAFGLDAEYVARILKNEGRWNATTNTWDTSSDGAVGSMQLMPGTFAEMARKYNIPGEITNDRANIFAGTAYLRESLLAGGGDPTRGAWGYNAGINRLNTYMRADVRPRGYSEDPVEYVNRLPTMPNETLSYGARVTDGYRNNPIVGRPVFGPPSILAPPVDPNAPAVATPNASQSETALRELTEFYSFVKGLGTLARRREDTSAQIKRLEDALDESNPNALVHRMDTGQRGEARSALYQLRGAQYQQLDGIQMALRNQAEKVQNLGADEGATRAYADRMREFESTAKIAGRDATTNERRQYTIDVMRELSAAYNDQINAMDRQVAGQTRIASAYSRGTEAVAHQSEIERAAEEVRKTKLRGTEAEAAAIEELAGKYRALRLVNVDNQSVARTQEMDRQIQLTRQQNGMIGMDARDSASTLAQFRERQAIEASNGDTSSAASLARIQRASEAALADFDFKRQQDAFNALASVGEQAFDRIGTSITEAFAQGKMKTLDFGNIARAVFSELVQQIMRMALLNPILNSLFGTNKVTLSSVGGVLGFIGGNGGSTSASGAGGVFSSGGGILSMISSIFGGGTDVSKASGSGLFGMFNGSNAVPGGFTPEQLGATEQDIQLALSNGTGARANPLTAAAADTGILSKLGTLSSGISILKNLGVGDYLGFGSGGGSGFSLGQSVSDLYNMQVIAPSISATGGLVNAEGAITNAAGYGSMAQNSIDSAGSATAAGFDSGASLGQIGGGALSIAGGAYGIYSGLEKGGIGGGFQVAGGAIGVAAGAVTLAASAGLISAAGTLAMMGPYGMIAAAILMIIGSLLPGEKPSNMEGNATIDLNDHRLQVGGQTGKKFSQGNRNAATSMVGNVVDLLDQIATNVGATGMTGSIRVGVGNRDGIYGAYDKTNFFRGYARDEEGSKNLLKDLIEQVVKNGLIGVREATQTALNGVKFDNLENALAQITAVSEATNNGKSSASQDIASRRLNFAADFEGSINQLKWVRDVYDYLKDGGINDERSSYLKQLKDIGKQWQELITHAESLGLATEFLTEAWAQATAEATAQRNVTLDNITGNIQGRRLKLDNDPLNNEKNKQAEILSYDLQARQEIINYKKQMLDVNATAAETASNLVLLEQVQGDERLAIVKKYADAIADAEKKQKDQQLVTATNWANNLTTFTTTLRLGDSSPLSAQSKLALADETFSTIIEKAKTGDWASMQKVAGAAGDVLSTSRIVNGSGAGYVADFEKVLAALDSMAAMTSDQLTASIYTETVKDQTTILKEALMALKDEVTKVRTELQQGSATPSRVS
jgi:soluble lytic murein transglycosylase-like protein